jgi:ADP-ribose pyrophosphatase
MRRIKHVEKLTDEKWINLFAASYEYNGHKGRWVFASRKEVPYQGKGLGDAVLIVPILVADGQPNRLVLEKEFRVPVGDYVYGLPAGLLEPGETIEETVRREMLEETGLEVVRCKRITPALYSSSGLSDEAAAIAYVDVRATPGSKQALEGTEDIEVLLLDYGQVCQLCENTAVHMDAKAWTTLYMYQQLGKLV